MPTTVFLDGRRLFQSAHIVERSQNVHPSGFSLLLATGVKFILVIMSGKMAADLSDIRL